MERSRLASEYPAPGGSGRARRDGDVYAASEQAGAVTCMRRSSGNAEGREGGLRAWKRGGRGLRR